MRFRHPSVHRNDLGRRDFLLGPGGQATFAPSTNQPYDNVDEPTIDGDDTIFPPVVDPDDAQQPPNGPQIPFHFQSVPDEVPTQVAPIATQEFPSVAFRPGIFSITTAATVMMSSQVPSPRPTVSPIQSLQQNPSTLSISPRPISSFNSVSSPTQAATVSTTIASATQAASSLAFDPSISAPAGATASDDSSSSMFNIPIILGIVVAGVVGIAVVAATISWILRMRRKEGFCGCISSTKADDDDLGKWDYNTSYMNATPDLFKDKPELMDYDGASATTSATSHSKDRNWSEITSGTYPPPTHPGSLYASGSLYGSFGRTPTPVPIIMQPPYIPPPSIPIHLALDGPYYTGTPRPSFCQVNDAFPNPHPSQPPPDIHTSPVQPTISPGGTLVVANLAPGDISDGLSRPSTQTPWMNSPNTPPPVTIPQRPWTESFSPHPGQGQERLKEDRVPLSPLPRETSQISESGPVPWQPLNVQSKSRAGSTLGSMQSRRNSMRSEPSSIAPRLPTPTTMSTVHTDASNSGWAATLKSNIFAALGAVGQMAGSTQGHDDEDVPAHPDAPLSERLTSVTPRSTRRRKAMQKAGEVDLEEGLGSGRMVSVESEVSSAASSAAPSRVNSVSGITESRPSRLYKNIKLSQRRHESQIKAINNARRTKGDGRLHVGGLQPARSASSMYSSSSSSGYTTDKGEVEEDILPHEILQMYAIGEMEEEGDGGHAHPAKTPSEVQARAAGSNV